MKHKDTQANTAPMEQERRADRFNIELPVEMGNMQGLTRNICATGIYFETDVAQAPGSHMRFTVEVTIRGEKTKMVCEGEVVRVEHKDGVVGIAVALSDSFFANHGPATEAKTGAQAALKKTQSGPAAVG